MEHRYKISKELHKPTTHETNCWYSTTEWSSPLKDKKRGRCRLPETRLITLVGKENQVEEKERRRPRVEKSQSVCLSLLGAGH